MSLMFITSFLTFAPQPVLSQNPDDVAIDTETLPPLELQVASIDGNAYSRPDQTSEWTNVRTGNKLSVNEWLKTTASSTVTLKIPGLAMLEVSPNSHLQLKELRRKQSSGGILSDENNMVNEVEMDVLEGEVKNSIKNYEEGLETDYKLSSPNAVAGVRGTTFQLDVNSGEDRDFERICSTSRYNSDRPTVSADLDGLRESTCKFRRSGEVVQLKFSLTDRNNWKFTGRAWNETTGEVQVSNTFSDEGSLQKIMKKFVNRSPVKATNDLLVQWLEGMQVDSEFLKEKLK